MNTSMSVMLVTGKPLEETMKKVAIAALHLAQNINYLQANMYHGASLVFQTFAELHAGVVTGLIQVEKNLGGKQ